MRTVLHLVMILLVVAAFARISAALYEMFG